MFISKYFRNRLLILCVQVFLLALPTVHAQGFLGIYPTSTPGLPQYPYVARFIDTLPGNGYQLTMVNYVLDARRRFSVDSAGTLTGDDAAALNLPAERVDWLSEGDYVSSRWDAAVPNKQLFRRMKVDGTTVWESEFTLPHSSVSTGYSYVLRVNDTLLLSCGTYKAYLPGDSLVQLYYTGIHTSGQVLWQTTVPFSSADVEYADVGAIFIPTADGGFVSNFSEPNGGSSLSRLFKIDAQGNIVWNNVVPVGFSGNAGNYGVQTTNGLLVCSFLNQMNLKGKLIYYAADGTIMQQIDVATLLGDLTGGSAVRSIVADANGGVLVVTGLSQEYNLLRLDGQGNLLWKRPCPLLNGKDLYFGPGRALPGDGFILSSAVFQPQLAGMLWRVDSTGSIFSNAVSGTAALEQVQDCQLSAAEILVSAPLAGWPVVVEHKGLHYYSSTNGAGQYQVPDLDTGALSLQLIPPSFLWQPCPAVIDTTMPNGSNVTLLLDLPVQIVAECPLMTVDAGASFLRRCFPNIVTLRYCNAGTAAADNVVIALTLDPALTVNQADLPYAQAGDTLYFTIGAVEALECSQFNVTVTPECDSTELGETVCLTVRITPDSLCAAPPGWTGATIVAAAECLGDSVRLSLRNIGTAVSTAGLDFIVVDDHVMMFNGQLPALAPQEAYILQEPADGGTWRIISEQEPNHPTPELASAAVEGCGPAGPGGSSLGFLLDFGIDDGDPFSEQVCEQLVGSWDPNDKQAVPRGVGPEHAIEPGQPLTYKLRFQNTGTDTAFTVVIRDTLPPGLDPATVRPGVSSHLYTWSLSGNGVITFTFAGIALPDSNMNEPASHGFVDFEVQQTPGLPLGTLLENRAAIYFDFNAPVITNTVWHTIDHNFLETATRIEEAPAEHSLAIYPNPAANTVFVTVPIRDINYAICRVYDAFGRLHTTQTVWGPEFRLERGALPAGLYTIVLFDRERMIGRGRVAWR